VHNVQDFLGYEGTITCIYIMLALSLDLQVGLTGLVNFGQVMFLAFGAYTAGVIVVHGGTPLLGAALATAIGALVGVLVSLTVRNMSATYWGMLSLALAEIARLVFLNENWIAQGANGLSVIVSIPGFRGFVATLATASLGLLWALSVSPFGRTVRLIREGDRLAQSLGKNVLLFKMISMAIGGGLGGLAGALYAFLNGYISPDDILPIQTFVLWAMVVLGGRGNAAGIVVGTLVVQAFFEGTRFLPSHVGGLNADVIAPLRLVVIGLLIMLVMIFRPEGVLPEWRRVYGPRTAYPDGPAAPALAGVGREEEHR
jgi:branched-chain amino acid transport system permease protein